MTEPLQAAKAAVMSAEPSEFRALMLFKLCAAERGWRTGVTKRQIGQVFYKGAKQRKRVTAVWEGFKSLMSPRCSADETSIHLNRHKPFARKPNHRGVWDAGDNTLD